MSAAPSPPHDFELDLELDFVPDDQPDAAPADPKSILAPAPLPDHEPIPFGILDIAPLIPDPVPAHVDPPVIEPLFPSPAPAPADVAPFHPVESDVHRIDLPIVFLQDIPVLRPGEESWSLSQYPSLTVSLSVYFCSPHSSPPPFARPSAPLTPFPEFGARFLTVEQQQQVTYISGLFQDVALSRWNLRVQIMGEAAAYALTWDELKELMRKEYCSQMEI
ncbi:protein TonB-like [Helianthus annuus]|uniref:protein TonB-like n=1 Tax=Helianthus annuus TaxID=4232 RepID=UPI000B8F2AC0|nr:protein TonB-like [Helianthus annuus]